MKHKKLRIEALLKLINSMNKSEKRYFKLTTKLQAGSKSYLFLYQCLAKNIPEEEALSLFIGRYGEKSIEPTSKYLYQQLLNCLSQSQSHDFCQTAIFKHISNASLLYERNLLNEAFTELAKAKKLAKQYENDILHLLVLRTEMHYLIEKNFPNTLEKEIIVRQTKINKCTKSIQNSNMHLSLYTIMQKRLQQLGSIRTNEQKTMMNDLVLTELNLTANSNYSGFQSMRLHLLFQASYYLSTGNYKSALRFYSELVRQFDEHPHLKQYPPVYYLKTLEGIVNTLVAMNLHDELHDFLDKLKELEQGGYPKDFILRVRYCIFSAKAKSVLNQNLSAEALHIMEEYKETLLEQAESLNMEMQLNLHLLTVGIYIWNENYRSAKKTLKTISLAEKNFHILPQYRISRFLNLIVKTEMGDYDFIDNEVRSIKRDIQKTSHLNLSEKIIFKYVLACPIPTAKAFRENIWHKLKKEADKVREDKLETQYLQTFNFIRWIEKKLLFPSFFPNTNS